MHLIIFGATGGVGRHLGTQSLAEGHRVTAFTRDAARLETPGPDFDVVEGGVLDGTAVRQAIEGGDRWSVRWACRCSTEMACALREPTRSSGRCRPAMSGLGAGDSLDLLPFHSRYLIFPLVMRRVYVDHENQEFLVMASGLDWTLVRPGNFTDGEYTKCYRHDFFAAESVPKLKVS